MSCFAAGQCDVLPWGMTGLGCQALLQVRDGYGRTPLHLAAWLGHVEDPWQQGFPWIPHEDALVSFNPSCWHLFSMKFLLFWVAFCHRCHCCLLFSWDVLAHPCHSSEVVEKLLEHPKCMLNATWPKKSAFFSFSDIETWKSTVSSHGTSVPFQEEAKTWTFCLEFGEALDAHQRTPLGLAMLEQRYSSQQGA